METYFSLGAFWIYFVHCECCKALPDSCKTKIICQTSSHIRLHVSSSVGPYPLERACKGVDAKCSTHSPVLEGFFALFYFFAVASVVSCSNAGSCTRKILYTSRVDPEYSEPREKRKYSFNHSHLQPPRTSPPPPTSLLLMDKNQKILLQLASETCKCNNNSNSNMSQLYRPHPQHQLIFRAFANPTLSLSSPSRPSPPPPYPVLPSHPLLTSVSVTFLRLMKYRTKGEGG